MPRSQTERNTQRVPGLWTEHDRRDLDRLIDTLADDAAYEIVPLKKEWRGKDEIREFYHMLWTAMPDVKLDLRTRVTSRITNYELRMSKRTSIRNS